jgi:hypothetical protein
MTVPLATGPALLQTTPISTGERLTGLFWSQLKPGDGSLQLFDEKEDNVNFVSFVMIKNCLFLVEKETMLVLHFKLLFDFSLAL